MTDDERFLKLQQDVLGATKAMIGLNAPGLPMAAIAAYVRQVGGNVMAVEESMDITKFNDPTPFRLCVTTKNRPDFINGRTDTVVDKVIGWG